MVSTQPRFQMKIAALALGCCLAGALLPAANITAEIAQSRADIKGKQWEKVRDRNMQLLADRLGELSARQAIGCYCQLVRACKSMEKPDPGAMLKGLDALLLKPDMPMTRYFAQALGAAAGALQDLGDREKASAIIDKSLVYTKGEYSGLRWMYTIKASHLKIQGKMADSRDVYHNLLCGQKSLDPLSRALTFNAVTAFVAAAKEDGNWPQAGLDWVHAISVWRGDDGKRDATGETKLFSFFRKDILPQLKNGQDAAKIARLAAGYIPGGIRTPLKSHELQRAVVLAYVQVGQKEKAMAAIKTLYQACPANRFDMTVTEIAGMLKKMDGSIARANRFLDYVKFGTVGPDGKPGTEDDTVDPFPAARAKMPPEVANAYKEAIEEEWDDTWEDKRCLSALYRYMDEPAEALKCLAEAFALAPMEPEPLQLVAGDMTNVLIQLSGNPADGDKLGQFLKYGKEGRDGKAGTDDDLTDPRKPYL